VSLNEINDIRKDLNSIRELNVKTKELPKFESIDKHEFILRFVVVKELSVPALLGMPTRLLV